ncbi:MAG: hypothetical protein ACAI38_13480 [Myxococcota bacterium]|nr:hypothetical protein [Myxococcota bacterium]
MPRDRKDTLARVEHGELRAGFTHHPPEVDCHAGGPRGDEVAMIERLAAKLEARLVTTCASEAELVEDLRALRIDIAAGAFDGQSPWRKRAGATLPHSRHSGRRFLVPPGENAWLMRVDRLIASAELSP